MDVLEILDEKAFWGHEFLTWLWFRIEQGDGEVDVPGLGVVTLWIEDRLVLGSLETQSKENILKQGEVAQSAEAAAALAVGKKVLEARFGLIHGEREFTFVLGGDTFDLTSLKVPPVEAGEEEQDWHGTLLLRAALIQEVLDVVDALFAAFTKARLEADWGSQTVPAMERWIAAKTGG